MTYSRSSDARLFRRSGAALPMAWRSDEASVRASEEAVDAGQWGPWMAAAQAGDAAAYRRLLSDLARWLRCYYARRLPMTLVDGAVRAARAALAAMNAKRHTYRPTDPFMPWMAAIARHACLDGLRHHPGWPRHPAG